MTPEHFQTLVAQRAPGVRLAVPVYRERAADLTTPTAALLALRQAGGYPFLLESVESGQRVGRYSFLGCGPYRVLEARDGQVTAHAGRGTRSDGAPPEFLGADAFAALEAELAGVQAAEVEGLPPFTGGAVGYMGYDAVRQREPLGTPPPDALGLPDAVWAFYDAVVAFDHARRTLVLMATAMVDDGTDAAAAFARAQDRLDGLERTLARPAPPPAPIRLLDEEPRPNTTRAAFEASVERVKRHVYDGDVFQLVLAQRLAQDFEGDPVALYRALRRVNPSPYLFYLDCAPPGAPALALVGSSPEMLVRVQGGRVETVPIAGTRPRGETPEADARHAAELLADPKERAEHVMLVDLGRNDLGRSCRAGTVAVEQYAAVERFSHVMHLTSRVAGELAEGASAVGALAACFPAGTVSGAPKVRAMQLIDELEPERRGAYAGAVGYAGWGGQLDTCIAIRTLVVRGRGGTRHTAYTQAGAGIVADSDPAREYEETLHKARALRRALEQAAEPA